MWRILTNMTITQRLMIAAAITALIPGLVIGILGSSYIDMLGTINQTVSQENSAVKLATQMQDYLARMNALLEELNPSPASVSDNALNSDTINQLTDEFSARLATYQQDYQISTAPGMQSIDAILQGDSQGNQAPASQHAMIYVVAMQWHKYQFAQSFVLQDIQPSHTGKETLFADVARANLEYLPLKGNVDNLVQMTEDISQMVAEINAARINPTVFWTVVAFFFSTLVVFAVSYLINLTITRPLRQLVRLTERITQGETSARAVVSGHDETYLVASSMNTMLDSIVRLMKNIQRQHDFLEDRVQELIREIKGLGTGDLRTRAEVTSDALGFLAHSFNCMLDELSHLVERVKLATDEIEILTRTTQLRMTRLVTVSDHQAQNMQEAVTATQQLAENALILGEQAQALATISHEITQAAHFHSGAPQVATILYPLLAILEKQRAAIVHLTSSLSQQVQLSQAAHSLVQDATEASSGMSEQTQETNRHLRKLIASTSRLHSLVGAFKLREEPHMHTLL